MRVVLSNGGTPEFTWPAGFVDALRSKGAELIDCCGSPMDAVIPDLGSAGGVTTIVLAPDGFSSRTAAVALAGKVGAGLVTGVTDLRPGEDGTPVLTRQVGYGRFEARYSTTGESTVIALAARSLLTSIGSDSPPFAGAVADAVESRASVVVCGGRGMGAPESFAALGRLAEAVGGTLAATGAAVAAGYAPRSAKVGLTGRRTAPDVYLAIGVAGWGHHLAGVRGATNLIAINSDAEAPVFEHAQVAVIGDQSVVVPLLLAELDSESSDGRTA